MHVVGSKKPSTVIVDAVVTRFLLEPIRRDGVHSNKNRAKLTALPIGEHRYLIQIVFCSSVAHRAPPGRRDSSRLTAKDGS
ncbi:hypothetical protein DO70_5189 [Burkholderia pseudomallei]|nr:hypothetical protein DO70_5189 [Burkholderia pseudomallei]